MAARLAFALGLAGWLVAVNLGIEAFIHPIHWTSARVAALAATALLCGALALRWGRREAAIAVALLLPALWACALWSLVDQPHPSRFYGWLAWPFALAVQGWVLARLSPRGEGWRHASHAGAMLLPAVLGAREFTWIVATYTERGTSWGIAAIAVVPAVLMLLVASRRADTRWPVAAEPHAWRSTGAGILAGTLAVWSLGANVLRDGDSYPLPYWPLLNAIDLAHILAGLAVACAWRAMRRSGVAPPRLLAGRGAALAAGAVVFVWLNAVLLRTLYHWWHVPYAFETVRRSMLAQVSLSVLWAVVALALMVAAARTARRGLWLLGGALMAVAVAKLVLFDFSHVIGITHLAG